MFYGRGLKGHAGCRQTEVQTNRQTDDLSRLRQRIGEQTKSRSYAKNWRTNKQTDEVSDLHQELPNKQSLGPTPRIGEQTKSRSRLKTARGQGAPIPVQTRHAASRPAASIARPTASLPLCPRNYGRGLM